MSHIKTKINGSVYEVSGPAGKLVIFQGTGEELNHYLIWLSQSSGIKKKHLHAIPIPLVVVYHEA